MFQVQFKNVCLESFGLHLPPHQVTSEEIEDRLAPLYKKLDVPFGTLDRLSGVKTRYFWDDSVKPSDVGTIAARQAIEESGIDPKELRALISCSVNRDCFEPATACMIHQNLKLSPESLVFDVSNACIGFSDGMMILANMIETGVLKAGVVVSGEPVSRAINVGIQKMLAKETVEREAFLKFLPTLTLGSGAVAAVLCHESISKHGHKIIGSAARSHTEYADLCVGDADYCYTQDDDSFNPLMTTEASKLISSGAIVGAAAWKDASETFGWTADSLGHIFCHQVGKQLNDAWYAAVGLPRSKEFIIYPRYGNMVSAAMPSAFAMATQEKDIRPGDQILMMAFGSGLNARFTGVIW